MLLNKVIVLTLAPLVLVKKPDGTNRYCVDFRLLNAKTIFDAEPIPDISEIFANLANDRYFTKIDLSKGYWQIPMKVEARPLTAFITHHGLFQFKTMPFGLVNAAATFKSRYEEAVKRYSKRRELHRHPNPYKYI